MEATLAYAQEQDQRDPLAQYRQQFHLPQHEGRDCLYFCGNSLGLQPQKVRQQLERELEQWATYGVEGHFKGEMPWMHYHHFFKESTAKIVGALPEEVVVMNTLTTNLHLLMVSFYQPTAQRYKILMEGGAFPSDQYAVESQLRFHGFDYEEGVIEIQPREGEHHLRTEDIEAAIEEAGDELALILFAGVNYYTGQFFDLQRITAAGHAVGAKVGFDLAHAAGNVPLKLHDWAPDFAVWCSYKYLNSGPGGPSGAFVHQRHADNPNLPRFAGWWGHDESRRFLMERGFVPMQGADGWQLSNAQIFAMAPHKASLDLFDAVGMSALRQKSLVLTKYLEFLVESLNQDTLHFRIITPKSDKDRGCQLSILTQEEDGKALFDYLTVQGVIADWREPNVIRLAPVPFYNSFEDVFGFYQLLKNWLAKD